MKPQHGIWVALSVMVLGACGGGDSNGTYSSGVDKSKAGSSMTTDEKSKFCSSAIRHSMSAVSKESMCKVMAVAFSAIVLLDNKATNATLQSACKSTFDGCMADSKTVSTEPSASDMKDCATEVAACRATTAEIEACINDYTVEVNKVMGAIPSCSALTLTSASMDEPKTAEPASCKALATKCPTLVESISES